MGNATSAVATAPQQQQQTTAALGSGPEPCPVLSGRASGDPSPSRCPVPLSARATAVYDVYGRRIDVPAAGGGGGGADPLAALRDSDVLDPTNNMPLAPNQQPSAGQKKLLSTERMTSTIPKGGTDATWLYPSPQMFFNALRRKGKGDDVTEDVMESVVRAHNTMNEVTWKHVADWEQLHCDACAYPTLLRFQGRPDDLSPLARLRGWLGGALPFDRHDWVVDRCGREVRYVIDFYHYEDKAGTPEAFEVVARPAVDSVDAGVDRVKMFIYRAFADWGLPCPISGHATGRFGGTQQQAAQQQQAREQAAAQAGGGGGGGQAMAT